MKWLFSQLSANELMHFSEWFEEFVADQWDKKIEADILVGRLDTAVKRADDEFLGGRASPLWAIFPKVFYIKRFRNE